MDRAVAIVVSGLLLSVGFAQAEPTKSPQQPPAQFERVTRVVGEVKEHVLTSREVVLSEILGELFSEDGRAQASLDGEQGLFVSAVNRALDEWVVFSEAKALDLAGVETRGQGQGNEAGSSQRSGEASAQQLTEQAFKKFASREAWKKVEPSPSEVREILRRKLAVRRFERLKMEAAQATVTDTDAIQYYRKNRLRFGGLPFENFKDNIKKMLSRSQTERRLAEWRTVLRRKYRARNSIGTGT